MSKRLSRFLIDKVDEKLGDIEKEKKFDIIMIVIGDILFVIGLLLVSVCKSGNSILFIGLVFLMLGLILSYVMTKEYIADCKKAKHE